MKITDMSKTTNLGGFTLLRPPVQEGQCPECHAFHDATEPHDNQSLFWQFNFREKHGRWSTWEDAMAHCTPEVRAMWISELGLLGIIVVMPTPAQPKKPLCRE
jgi:hypothetical protein